MNPVANVENGTTGITMHDWFAGQALMGLLAADKNASIDITAQLAWDMADYMLSYRDERLGL
jgi:hypothetical protein